MTRAVTHPQPVPGIPPVGPPTPTPEDGWRVTRHADVRAILADQRYVVPAAARGRPGTIAALRGSVARFSNGAEHARRRGYVVAELRELAPRTLRQTAYEATRVELDRARDSGRLDVMARLARTVPVGVLAAELGTEDVPGAVVAVGQVAAAYHPGASEQRQRTGDAAVARLAAMLAPAPPEVLANRIGLLVQACDATAGLLGNAVNHALRLPTEHVAAWPTEAILAEVLRYDPPVRLTRRITRARVELGGVAVPVGTAVLLRFDAANRDPAVFADPGRFDPDRFASRGRRTPESTATQSDPDRPDLGADPATVLTLGYGPRSCPGDRHGLALAAGIFDALRGRCRAAGAVVDYEPSANLRIPSRLEVVHDD